MPYIFGNSFSKEGAESFGKKEQKERAVGSLSKILERDAGAELITTTAPGEDTVI